MQSVQGTPKDPKTGIITLMRKFDADVFDRTEPQRVAARQAAERKAEAARVEAERKAELLRQEEERKAEIAHKLHEARLRLDEETRRMQRLIGAAAGLVSAEAGYEAALKKAADIRVGTDIERMHRQAAVLSGMNDRLSAAVSAKIAQQEAERAWIRREQELEAAKRFRLGALIAGLLLALGLYTGIFVTRKWRFTRQARAWRGTLDAAMQQYIRFYQEYTAFPTDSTSPVKRCSLSPRWRQMPPPCTCPR